MKKYIDFISESNDVDPYGEEDWRNIDYELIKSIIHNELNYFNGRMISASKSGYRKLNPNNLPVFNSCIYIEEVEVYSGCDIDLTKDFKILKMIADDNDVVISVYPELGGSYIWRSDVGLSDFVKNYYDENLMRKANENVSELDPYGEEEWGEKKKVDDIYVIYVSGQDANFLCQKKFRIADIRRGWREYYYEMAKFEHNVISFDSNCTVPSMSAYEVDKKDSVLDGTEKIGCIVGLGGTKFDTLQNLCDLAGIDMDCVKLYNGYN